MSCDNRRFSWAFLHEEKGETFTWNQFVNTHTQNIQIDSHETEAKQKEKLFYLLS